MIREKMTTPEQQRSAHQDLIREIADLNRQVFARSRLAGAEAWTDAGITLVQLKVLLLLQVEHQLSVSGVSSRLGVHISTAGQLLDRMVDQGLLYRRADEHDRRVIVARLSEQGERILQQMDGGNHAAAAALARLSHEELEALAKGMRALARAIAEET